MPPVYYPGCPLLPTSGNISGANVMPPASTGGAVHYLYVRPGGSDLLGTGTLAHPWAHVAYAVTQIPVFHSDDVWWINCNGCVEILTDSLRLPNWQAPGVTLQYDYAAPGPLRVEFGTVNIIADLVPVFVMPAYAVAHDPRNGIVTITPTVAPGWVPGAYAGKLIYGSVVGEVASISHNTATTMEIDTTTAFTPPLTVADYGAELRYDNAVDYWEDSTIQVEGVGCAVTFQGFKITNMQAALGFTQAVQVGRSDYVACYACRVDGYLIAGGNVAQLLCDACYMPAGSTATQYGGEVFWRMGYWQGVLNTNYSGGAQGQSFFFQDVFAGCSSLGDGGNGEVESTWEFLACAVRDGTGDGIYCHAGNCSVRQVSIDGCAGLGVVAFGVNAELELIDVVGTNGAVQGCTVDGGARVRKSGTTAVMGTGGAAVAVKIGALAACAWAATPLIDPASSSQVSV